MKVYFSTVVRAAPVDEGGELVTLDWDDKKIIRKQPIHPDKPKVNDPNPRGNTRGGRGISLVGDKVVVASYHTLKVFDQDLTHHYDISHGLMVGLHEICANEGGIWVTSTAIDAALKYSWKGRLLDEFWPREMPNISGCLDVAPLQIDKVADNRLKFVSSEHALNKNHLHLNALTEHQGQLYALLNSPGVIVNLTQDQIVMQNNSLKGGHNLEITKNGYVYVNNTKQNGTSIYDLNSGNIIDQFEIDAYEWVRGLIRTKVNLLSKSTHLLTDRFPGLFKFLRRHVISHWGQNIPVAVAAPLFMRGLQSTIDKGI